MKLSTLLVVGLAIGAAILLPRWLASNPAQAPNYAPPPRALNHNVTQANMGSTICRRGWTATIRPPVSYTSAMKRRQIAERHLLRSPSDYQEDHFIPLGLGGHPTSPANLWPELWPQARLKGVASTGSTAPCAPAA